MLFEPPTPSICCVPDGTTITALVVASTFFTKKICPDSPDAGGRVSVMAPPAALPSTLELLVERLRLVEMVIGGASVETPVIADSRVVTRCGRLLGLI
jgi:hypothetical protein